tara:strand:+ start:2338 stop:2613 length:276 start_codon:yes stop_codon:yes gene_type:complete
MSLSEFNLYWLGYHDRLDLQMDMIAWHASISVSPWTKKGKRVTPDKLRGKKTAAKPSSGAEVLSELEANAEKRDQDSFWREGKGKKWQKPE